MKDYSTSMRFRANPLVIIPLLLVLAMVVVLDRPLGRIPPLGRILNPFTGLWRTPFQSVLENSEVRSENLQDVVRVLWDDARVPHIMAGNSHDAYWTQGYVHASQRFFQMDLQARAGQGQLAELLGERALPMDETFIRIGLREATRRTHAKMFADPETKAMIEAYASGVNYWLTTQGQLQPPTEYRLLGVAPQAWGLESVAGLFVLMSFRLAGRTHDLAMTKYRREFGHERVEALFPEFLPSHHESPFASGQRFEIPKGLKPPVSWNFDTAIKEFPALLQPFQGNGSNSWAVGAHKSRTGTAIVANDTHLGLSMPSIWFEQQLTYPGTNVYGGGFAGAMGVLVGFNEKVTWAVTNATTDVADWYEVRFKDDKSSEYLAPEGWRMAELRSEPIRTKTGHLKTIDLLWTDLGPVVSREGRLGLVLRWTVHDGGNALSTFTRLNRAGSFAECERAIEDFFAPAQNFICADQNNIAITQAGALPIRWRGQGRYVMDGADPAHRWRGYYPSKDWPKSVNPKSGFVWSANQKPVTEQADFYMGWDSEEAFRAIRVHEELEARAIVDVEAMIAMQQNTLDPLARGALPLMLPLLTGELSSEAARTLDLLTAWDLRADMESVGATIFDRWWYEFAEMVWSDQLGDRKSGRWPKSQRLLLLIENLKQNASHDDQYWVDNILTPERETLPEVISRSFLLAVARLIEGYGRDPKGWQLAVARPAKMSHVGRFPGLGEAVAAHGSKFAINAMQTGHGPTWRMVVAQGESVTAFTSVSGSTAGEPLSQDYNLGLTEWGQGRYKQVLFITGSNMDSINDRITNIWTFFPEK